MKKFYQLSMEKGCKKQKKVAASKEAIKSDLIVEDLENEGGILFSVDTGDD